MNDAASTLLRNSHYVVKKNVEDITHEESLMTPEKGGNSLNWIVGHIVVHRDVIAGMLGLEKFLDEKNTELYKRGSENIDPSLAKDFTELMKLYDSSHEKIIEVLNEKDFADDQEISRGLVGLGFHEAYHCGQTGVLRRVIGKAGAIK